MKVILMHGKDTDPSKKWYPWLAQEIKKMGIDFLAPKLPNSDDPEINTWLLELEKIQPDEETILIGHSRGGVAILRYLEKLPEDKKIKKVILVATNSGSSFKRNKTENNKGFFTENGYDFEKIKLHCNDFVVLHSKDDQWVPFESGVENSKGLNAKFLEFNNRGHFGKGIKDIPELLNEIIEEYGKFIFRTTTNIMFSALSSYYVWKWLEQSRNINEVGEENAKRNVEIIKKYSYLLHSVFYMSYKTFVIDLSIFFDSEKYQESYSLNKLIKILDHKLNLGEIDSLKEKILNIKKRHGVTISLILELRNESVAHKSLNSNKSWIEYSKIEDLFDGVQEIFNLISKYYDKSITVWDHIKGDVERDMKWVFDNLERGEKVRLDEIDKKWKLELENKN